MASRSGRPALTAAVAAAVVITAVVIIAVLGRATPPELPSIDEQPDPPVRGELVALTSGDDSGDDETCVIHVDLVTRSRRTLTCDEERLGDIGWTAHGTVQATAHHDGGLVRVVTVTVASGEVDERILDHRTAPLVDDGIATRYGPADRSDGVRATIGHDPEPTVTVIDRDGTVRGEQRFEATRHYRLRGIGWSPNGRWLVVHDSAERLLVLDDRGQNPRVLIEGVRDAAWRPRGGPGSERPR